MNQAMIAGFDPGSILDAAQGFVSHGPLGLAGLLLALIITTLVVRNVDPARERMLKLVLYIGTFCFVAALVVQLISAPRNSPPDFRKQRAVLSTTSKDLSDAEQALKEIRGMASDGGGCPGHGSGIPIPHGADMASRSAGVLATIQGATGNIKNVIDSLPAEEHE
jgi:hypothetical protein